jgi:hypothetical protein
LEIDFNYSKEININQVWAQLIWNAFERQNYNPELTAEDIQENEKRNEKYKQVSLEQKLFSPFENLKTKLIF